MTAPFHGDKPNDLRYWPTVKAFVVLGVPVPDFIKEREPK